MKVLICCQFWSEDESGQVEVVSHQLPGQGQKLVVTTRSRWVSRGPRDRGL